MTMITDPDLLLARSDCETIKDQKKIKIGRVLLKFDGHAKSVYIKRYNAFSWRYRLMSLLTYSGAYRSLRGAAVLARSSIQTAVPLAAVERRRWGFLSRSYYLSEEIGQGKTVDAYWLETLRPMAGAEGECRRRQLLETLAFLLRTLHARYVYHNDLKDANVLIAQGPETKPRVFLLDLEGVSRCLFLSKRRRVKNLVQLNRTLGKYLTRGQKLFFLKRYLADRAAEKRVLKWWVKRILRATEMADKRSLKKIPPERRSLTAAGFR